MSETLAVQMDSKNHPGTLPNVSDEFDGEQVTIWLERAKEEKYKRRDRL
jgi:hypothetical protein